MNKICENTFKHACIKDYKNNHETGSKQDIQREVFKTSILIRWSWFLSSPLEANVHTDLFGATDLSSDLVNFFTIATKNLQDYIPKILEQEDINLTTCSWQSKKKKIARRSRTKQLEK